MSSLLIRKLVTNAELHMSEIGRSIEPPIKSVIVAAIIKNPWSGAGYVDDLDPMIREVAPELAKIMVPAMIKAIGGPENIEAFGKAAIVGTEGEIEHASALIHTLRFGNPFREAARGTSYLSFTNKRGGPGALLTFPLTHKEDISKRDYYLTVETAIPDAPAPDELIVAIGASSGGRPFARIGDRHKDKATGVA